MLCLSTAGLIGIVGGAPILNYYITKRFEKLETLEGIANKNHLPYKPTFWNLNNYEKEYGPLLKELSNT